MKRKLVEQSSPDVSTCKPSQFTCEIYGAKTIKAGRPVLWDSSVTLMKEKEALRQVISKWCNNVKNSPVLFKCDVTSAEQNSIFDWNKCSFFCTLF